MVDFIHKSKRFQLNHGSTICHSPQSCHNSSVIASFLPSVLPANTLYDTGKGWGSRDHMVDVSPSAIRPIYNLLPQPSVAIAFNNYRCNNHPVSTPIDTYPAPIGAVKGFVRSRFQTRSWRLFLFTTHQTTTLHLLVTRVKAHILFSLFINNFQVKHQCNTHGDSCYIQHWLPITHGGDTCYPDSGYLNKTTVATPKKDRFHKT